MANTFEAIATVTVGSGGAANITFSSIPNTYTDLFVLLSLRNVNGETNGTLVIKPNGSTSSVSFRGLYGNGASASSTSGTTNLIIGYPDTANQTASTFSSHSVYIPNYAGSNNKSISADAVQENNATTAYAFLGAGLWSNSSAITSLEFADLLGNFAQYSTATLYGIKNS